MQCFIYDVRCRNSAWCFFVCEGTCVGSTSLLSAVGCILSASARNSFEIFAHKQSNLPKRTKLHISNAAAVSEMSLSKHVAWPSLHDSSTQWLLGNSNTRHAWLMDRWKAKPRLGFPTGSPINNSQLTIVFNPLKRKCWSWMLRKNSQLLTESNPQPSGY